MVYAILQWYQIIFKMDKFGQGVEFQYSMLPKNKDLSFAGFTKQMLLEMCILSGCDYLPSLPGMGLKRAHTLISKFKSYEKVSFTAFFILISLIWIRQESFVEPGQVRAVRFCIFLKVLTHIPTKEHVNSVWLVHAEINVYTWRWCMIISGN